METKANYALIGGFALAGFLGVMGFFLAFGGLRLSADFARFEARFEAVSGLSNGADVQFAGLKVGQVTGVTLETDGRVLVTMDVARTTPVRADTQAMVDSSGLTGVAYMALLAGTPDSPLVNDRDTVVELPVGRSTMQSLTESAPQVLDRALQVVEQVNRLLGDENQNRVSAILGNLEQSSGALSDALVNFGQLSDTFSEATETFALFTDNVAPLLLQAEKTIESLQFAIDEAALVATEARHTFEAGTETLQTTNTFIADDLTALVADLKTSARDIRAEIEGFSREAQVTFDQFTKTGIAVESRIVALDPALARLEPLLVRADGALARLDAMAASVDTLVAGDGAALVAEARAMVASARTAADQVALVAETDLPAIMADIRAATADIRATVAQVGADLSNASGRVDEISAASVQTLEQVTDTFARANTTLDAINRALDVGQGTLLAAERAFEGADRVINEDISQITADLRGVLDRLGNAVDAVSLDIPAVTADLRRTAESAARTIDDLGRVVRDTSGPVRDFASNGLPNITQLTRETRNLISNLDRLTGQLQSDPTRFLLNRQTPEFRR